jgi:hypothetical protein
MKEEIIQAYKEYIDVLTDEINDLIGSAYVHGFRSRNVVRGELARAKIEQLLNKEQNPERSVATEAQSSDGLLANNDLDKITVAVKEDWKERALNDFIAVDEIPEPYLEGIKNMLDWIENNIINKQK